MAQAAGAAAVVAMVAVTGLAAGCDSAADPAADPTPAPSTRAAICAEPPTVEVGDEAPVVLYALRFTVPPGERVRGARDATAYSYPPVSPGVTGADGETAAQVAGVLGGTTTLDGVRGLSWDVVNRTDRPARYLAFAGATVTRARWTSQCDDRRGTAVVLGPVRDGVVRCGETGARGLRAAAVTIACHRDTAEAAPFRDLGRTLSGPTPSG